MTRTSGKTLALLLGTGPQDGATVAALRLIDAAIARGHRVAVYAYGDGVRATTTGTATAPVVAQVLRDGVHGGLASWVVDRRAVEACTGAEQVPGVVQGGGGDLWRFVVDADVALGVAR